MDHGTLPTPVLNELKHGLRTKRNGWARRICSRPRNPVRTTKGTIAYVPSKYTLVRDEDALAPGEPMKPSQIKLGTVEYQALRYYGHAVLTDEDIIDLGYYDESLVEDRGEFAIIDSETRLDLKLSRVMSDTNLNLEYDVTSDGNGAWTDTTNSTPIEDLLEVRRTLVPGADLLVYGQDVRDALLSHPDIYAESSRIPAGSADIDSVSEYLKRKIGVSEVIYIEGNYDTAAEGLAHSVGRLFGTGLWMGYKSNLILVPVDGDNADKLEMERSNTESQYDLTYYQLADIVRPVQECGATVTGIIAS